MKKIVLSAVPIIVVLAILIIFSSGCTVTPDPPEPPEPEPVCGDGLCNAEENSNSCPQDCGPPRGNCGDGICGPAEQANPNLCPEDCKTTCVPDCSGKTCGNDGCEGSCGVCGGGEFCNASNQCELTQIFDSPFGSHGGTENNGVLTPELFSELNSIGVKYKRLAGPQGLHWTVAAPNLDPPYDWSKLALERDNVIDIANDNGISLMVTIKAGKKVNRETCDSPNPCDMGKYESFLAAAIQRYGSQIKLWQVENEVSGNFYDGTPEEYAEFLASSYNVIKDNCPDCQVLIAGMPGISDIGSPSNKDYYGDILNAVKNNPECPTGCFDIFDVHLPPLRKGHETIEQRYEAAITLLSTYGYSSKPFWSTEYGTLGTLADTSLKIEHELIKLYVVGLEQGIEKLFWRVSECPSCILEAPGSRTNNYDAYKTLIQKLDGFNSVLKLKESQYKFTFPGKTVYVVWCDSGSCSLSSEISGTVRVTDYKGDEETKDASQIVLEKSPVFVEKV